MRGAFLAMFGSIALAVLVAAPAMAADPVWVALQGPSNALPEPRPDYTLEIGDLGWRIDGQTFDAPGSAAIVDATGPIVVRLRRLSDCQPVVMFVARPGTLWIIRFLSGTSFRVEDWTKNGLDALGGMPAGGPLLCPPLPDTATAAAPPAPAASLPMLWLGASLLAASAVALLMRRRQGSAARRR